MMRIPPVLSPAPARLDLSADYWLVPHVSADVVLRFDGTVVRPKRVWRGRRKRAIPKGRTVITAWRNESHWHRVREAQVRQLLTGQRT